VAQASSRLTNLLQGEHCFTSEHVAELRLFVNLLSISKQQCIIEPPGKKVTECNLTK